jgi:hypothetical protein
MTDFSDLGHYTLTDEYSFYTFWETALFLFSSDIL